MLVFVSDKITSHPTDWIKYEYLVKYIISWFVLEQRELAEG